MTDDMTDDMTADVTKNDASADSPDAHGEPVAVAVHPERGEAEVTVAHLGANGIDAFIVDQVEGGAVPIEGEWGVAVVVKAVDAELARQVLTTDVAIDEGAAIDEGL
jgi:hypothetical protein